MLQVAVVVLNWNDAFTTVACLNSLDEASYPPIEIVVVDNGSSDNSIQHILGKYPNITVLETGENLGYAAGNNIGIRYALEIGAEWILILNNDTLLAPDCLLELMKAAEDTKDSGALGPLVYQSDTSNEIQSAGGFLINGLRYSWRRMGEVDDGELDRVCSVDLLPGCALLLSRHVLEKVGLFDERFFLYREDIDLCLRISKAGYRLYLVPTAHLWHRRPRIGKQVPPHIVYYMARNSLLLAWKHHMPLEMLRFLWKDLTAWVLWRLSPRWRGMKEQATARADGVKDFFLGRFGRSDKWTPRK